MPTTPRPPTRPTELALGHQDRHAATAGSLTFNGSAVVAGQFIPAASLASWRFTPAASESGSPYATFTFQAQDNGARPTRASISIRSPRRSDQP